MPRTLASLLVSACIASTTATAIAQPLQTTPIAAPPAERSVATAHLLSMGATIGGYTLLYAGAGDEAAMWAGLGLITVGPSLGHVYAGENGHAAVTSLVRLGSAGAMAVGLVMVLDECDLECDNASSDEDLGTALAVAGGFTFAALTIYDLLDAGPAVRRANQRAALQVTPTAFGTPSGERAYGLGLGGRF